MRNDMIDDGNAILVDGCLFQDIECRDDGNCVVLNDSLNFCDVSITSTKLINCDSGFYASSHLSQSDITFSGITIETAKVYAEDQDAFLRFENADSVIMKGLSLVYSYDIS